MTTTLTVGGFIYNIIIESYLGGLGMLWYPHISVIYNKDIHAEQDITEIRFITICLVDISQIPLVN